MHFANPQISNWTIGLRWGMYGNGSACQTQWILDQHCVDWEESWDGWGDDLGEWWWAMRWRRLLGKNLFWWTGGIGHPHENPTERCQWLACSHGLSDSALHPKNLNLRTQKLPLTHKPKLRDYYSKRAFHPSLASSTSAYLHGKRDRSSDIDSYQNRHPLIKAYFEVIFSHYV